jgi:NitT/TauT family transport system substrate-binding protein
MRMLSRVSTVLGAAALAISALIGTPAAAQQKEFKVAFATYIGYEPMRYMKQSGILKKWADKYGISIDVIIANDYVGGMTQFTAGEIDAYATTSLDALTMPAAGGIDTSIFLITDFSNGNDQILSKTAKTMKDLTGQTVWVMQFTISHYLLQRALSISGMPLDSITVSNLSDADQAAAYVARDEIQHIVTFKPASTPMVASVPGTTEIFNSSQTPHEIMDLLIAKTETLKASPEFAKALTGAWYEAMEVLHDPEKSKDMKAFMASALATDLAGLEDQFETTEFLTPADAYKAMTEPALVESFTYIRNFAFESGLFGQSARSLDDIVGTQFADGTVLGDPNNVMLRIDPTFTKMAADGAL